MFELSPPPDQQTQWRERVLWSFMRTSYDDGESPLAGLLADKRGNLYGTTSYGGANYCFGRDSVGCGTVFEVGSAPRARSPKALKIWRSE